jgi:hypothetical protein
MMISPAPINFGSLASCSMASSTASADAVVAAPGSFTSLPEANAEVQNLTQHLGLYLKAIGHLVTIVP